MPDRKQRERQEETPAPWDRKKDLDPLGGPRTPDTQKPDTNSILKRMKAVDPKQARRYRQRAGQ